MSKVLFNSTGSRALMFALTGLTLVSCGSAEHPLEAKLRNRITLSEHPFIDVVAPRATVTSLQFDNLVDINPANIADRLNAHLPQSGFSYMVNQVRATPAGRTFKFHLSFNGLPLCDYDVKAKENAKTSSVRILSNASMHELNSINDVIDEHVSLQEATNLSFLALAEDGVNTNNAMPIYQEACFVKEGNSLVSVRDIYVSADNLTYKLRVSRDGVLSTEPYFFDVTGSARVYAKNIVDGELKDFKLKGLVGDGTLENDYFTTSTTNTRAEESDHEFNYSPSDPRFDETSLFVHANEQLQWFEGLGYEWTSDDKINIFVHAVTSGSTNNALYTPGIGARPPKIQVGKGDGTRLQNLSTDSDVVAHEFGHHVVFDSLRETRGESLVLHEGLADFFAMARAGDSCLGESICPYNSPINCEVNKKAPETSCLRSATAEKYVLNKNTKAEPHFKSQFVSGMLWELRDGDMGEETTDRVVYEAVRNLLSRSGYHDMVLAMLIADYDLNDGKYCDEIYNIAVERGLGSYIEDISCDEDLPTLEDLDNAGAEVVDSAGSTRGSSKKKGLIPGCGSIREGGDFANSIFNMMIFFFGLAFPLMLSVHRTCRCKRISFKGRQG